MAAVSQNQLNMHFERCTKNAFIKTTKHTIHYICWISVPCLFVWLIVPVDFKFENIEGKYRVPQEKDCGEFL